MRCGVCGSFSEDAWMSMVYAVHSREKYLRCPGCGTILFAGDFKYVLEFHSEQRGNGQNYIKGKDGKFEGSSPGSGSGSISGKGIDKSDESGIIKEIEVIGIKGILHIPAVSIDTSKLSIDNAHISDRNHNVDLEEAISFIDNAKVSFTRWNGKFENYYSEHGAAYVDVANNIIRTSFKSAEYDDKTLKLMEVLSKYGK